MRVTPPQGVTDPDLTQNVATDTDPIEALADLQIFKSLSNATPIPGAQVSFTVRVRNAGPAAAGGVQVSDQLPPELSYVSHQAGTGSYDPTTGLWTVGALPVGGETVLAIVADVLDTPFTNEASVTSQGPRDPNLENNTRAAETGIQPIDIEVSKTADRAVVGVGELVTFTIVVQNNGPAEALQVIGRDVLPAGLAFVSAGPGYDPATGNLNLGRLPVGDRVALAITARVTQVGPMTNGVRVNTQGQADPALRNNLDSAAIEGVAADLALAKTASTLQALPGEAYTFTITVTNTGPSDASGVVVSEPPPSGARLLSSATSQGVYDAATGVWDVGGLAVGESATLDLEVIDQQIEPYTNTASIVGADQPDPNVANNQASVTITTPADLRLTKTADAAQATPGGVLIYTLTFTNAGPTAVEEALLTEEVPANSTFVTAQSDAGWSCAEGSPAITECRLSLGTLAPGASGTRRFAVRVASTLAPDVTAIDNRAVVGSAELGAVEPTPSDNADDEYTPFVPTAVTLVRFTAYRTGSTVVLEWETATELDTRRFRVWRSMSGHRDDADMVAEVAARGVGGRGAAYTYVDRGVERGVVYTYWLEEIETDGTIVPLAARTVLPYQLMLPTARR